MANHLYDDKTLQVFEKATLDLIDNAYQIATNPSEWISKHMNNMHPCHAAMEFRTLQLRGSRGIGHTNIINRVAYDVGHDIGQKYSTLILSMYPRAAMDHYMPHRKHEAELRNPLMAKYSANYCNELNRMSQGHYKFGKVMSGEIPSPSFNVERFLGYHRDTIGLLTDVNMWEQPFDILFVDGASRMSPEQEDSMYLMFEDMVELFVLIQ